PVFNFGIGKPGFCHYTVIIAGVLLFYLLYLLSSIVNTPLCNIIGIEVIVYIVFILIGPCYTQDHILLSCSGISSPLMPETRNANKHLKSLFGYIVIITCKAVIIIYCKRNCPVA